MSKFHPDWLTDEQCLSGVSWETYSELYRVTEWLAKESGDLLDAIAEGKSFPEMADNIDRLSDAWWNYKKDES
jgi:hypothetical protein